jgi:hypothetical protein
VPGRKKPSIEGKQLPVRVFVKDTKIRRYIHIVIKSDETFVGRCAWLRLLGGDEQSSFTSCREK